MTGKSIFKYRPGHSERQTVGTAEAVPFRPGGSTNSERKAVTERMREIEGEQPCYYATSRVRRGDAALRAWRLVQGGKLHPDAVAGLRRDWAVEFKEFEKARP